MPKVWGSADGKEVHHTTLSSETLQVDVSSLGAALVAVRVKVKDDWLDVLLGYDVCEQYPAAGEPTREGKPNFGTVVGRCANRIADGKFELDEQTFQLNQNNGPNHLHGGVEGFYSQVFDIAASSDSSVTFVLSEPDGAMGYPGKVDVSVTYEVIGNELHFRYGGQCDKPTLLSMTNHGYWNLKGHHAGNVLDHKLLVVASRTTAVNESLIITGELLSVADTALDFRGPEPRLLQEAVDNGGPIDVNYCLDRSEDRPGEEMMAARLCGPNGLSMEVWTDQPGLQVFTGQNIDPENTKWWHGKLTKWNKFGAICLEPQLWPDGIHQAHFPSPVLRPGETYKHHSWHVFKLDE